MTDSFDAFADFRMDGHNVIITGSAQVMIADLDGDNLNYKAEHHGIIPAINFHCSHPELPEGRVIPISFSTSRQRRDHRMISTAKSMSDRRASASKDGWRLGWSGGAVPSKLQTAGNGTILPPALQRPRGRLGKQVPASSGMAAQGARFCPDAYPQHKGVQ